MFSVSITGSSAPALFSHTTNDVLRAIATHPTSPHRIAAKAELKRRGQVWHANSLRAS